MEAEVRDGLRDEFAYKNNRFNTLMVCDTVMLGCAFGLVSDGGLPDPVEAAVSLESLRAFTGFELPVVVLSYGWASAAHPDPTGEQLQLLLPVLESIVRFCDGHGGGRCSFGVLWDFASLPQKGHTDPTADPKAEDRTPEQLARFRAGLSSINAWCAAAHAHTLAMILLAHLILSSHLLI